MRRLFSTLSRLARYAVLMAAALLQAGCAWFGAEDTPRAEMIAAPEMTQTLQEAQARLSSSNAWPQQDWWQAFADPALTRLIATALAANHDLKTAAARLRQAQAQVDAQAAELYPTVGANVSFSAQRFSANSTQAKLAGENFRQVLFNPLVLRYHLDLWGRDKAQLSAAVGTALADAAELAHTRLLLAAAVARGYFALAAAEEKLRYLQQIIASRRRQLQVAQVQLQNGLAPKEPALQAQFDLQGAVQREAEVRAEVKLLRNLLATLCGNGPDWGMRLDVQPGSAAERIALPQNLPLRLLSRRPDVVAAKLRVEAAAEEIHAAETAFYPDVNLIGFAGLHSVSLTDVLLQGSSLAYAVGPSIDLPIFEGGRLRANLSNREAGYDAAVENYNSRLLAAVREVADALAACLETETQRAAQQLSVATVAARERLAAELNSSGLNDDGEVAAARIAEYEQRLNLAVVQSEQRKSAVNLFVALGGGYSGNNNSPIGSNGP